MTYDDDRDELELSFRTTIKITLKEYFFNFEIEE